MGSADPPKKLGSYELLGLLATGGMAEVFLARSPLPQSSAQGGTASPSGAVVIKRVLPHLARQPTFHDMFLDEARIVSRVDHPNVVRVHELHDEDGELFLVMEHLEGESLAVVLRHLRKAKTLLPIDVAIHIAVEAARGLHAAHELRNDAGKSLDIVHRDVSPHNLIVQFDGRVKVIDFGIAKAAERQANHTQTGQVKGKFAYMPPEQIGAQQVDRRADVFALGIVLHEMLTGQKLFDREHELLVLRAICEEPIPPPSAKRPDVPASLDAVVMKALSRSRDGRHATALEFREELTRVLEELGGGAARHPRTDTGARRLDLGVRVAAIMGTLFEERIARQKDLLTKVRAGGPIPPARASSPHSDPSLSNPSRPSSHAAGIDVPRHAGSGDHERSDADARISLPTPSHPLGAMIERGADSTPPSKIERSDNIGQSLTVAPLETRRARSRTPWIVGAAAAAVTLVIVLVVALGSSPTDPSTASSAPSGAAPIASAPAASVATATVAALAASSSPLAASAAPSVASSAAPRATGPGSPGVGQAQPRPTAPATGLVAPKPTAKSTGFTRFE